MDKYDISVIVTTWNRASFLIDALDSLKKQDHKGTMQVIVCDDGSIDETPDVIKRYEGEFSDYKLVSFDTKDEERIECSRLPRMINKALKLAKGRYISYLPDDDIYMPERSRFMIEYLDKNEQVYLAYHFMKLILISPDKAVVGEAIDLCDRWDKTMKYWVENIYNRIDHTSIVHRNLGEENIEWNEDPAFKRAADWGFLLRVLKKDYEIASVERYLALGRKIQGMSLNRDGDQMIKKINNGVKWKGKYIMLARIAERLVIGDAPFPRIILIKWALRKPL